MYLYIYIGIYLQNDNVNNDIGNYTKCVAFVIIFFNNAQTGI